MTKVDGVTLNALGARQLTLTELDLTKAAPGSVASAEVWRAFAEIDLADLVTNDGLSLRELFHDVDLHAMAALEVTDLAEEALRLSVGAVGRLGEEGRAVLAAMQTGRRDYAAERKAIRAEERARAEARERGRDRTPFPAEVPAVDVPAREKVS